MPVTRPKKPVEEPASDHAGEVRPEVLYLAEDLRRRLGIGRWAMRTARNSGLRVIRSLGKNWVLGSDWIAYIVGGNSHTEK